MSRISAVLGKISPESSYESSTGAPGAGRAHAREKEYAALIERLLQGPAAVAVIGSGCGEGATDVCEGIAAELSGAGRRVVLVSVHRVLESGPVALSEKTVFMPGAVRNVWRWPSFFGQRMESFQPGAAGAGWMETLRRNFDVVLLDCPALETPPGVAAVAAAADSAVLAVEAARTTKHQMLRDRHALRASGVNLAGCVLIRAR
jgi:Mrp family chromosome partitioning ATPase